MRRTFFINHFREIDEKLYDILQYHFTIRLIKEDFKKDECKMVSFLNQ